MARHAAFASTRAPRVAPEPRIVACRRASTTARCASGGWSGPRRPPTCRDDGRVAPAPGRSLLRARSYHSRWAISVYGKEPGAPMREYEGYEREMAAFRAKGLAFDDAMVNDDPTFGAGRASRRAGDAEGDPASPGADHLGNIDKRWDEERACFEDQDERRADTDFPTESSADDWCGRDFDSEASLAAANDSRLSSDESFESRSNAKPLNPEDPPLPPGLYLVGTPIGNLEDITLRALRVLRSADAVLAEDTRHTGRLLKRYGIEKRRLVSYHAHNERSRRDALVDRVRGGAALALVSDAGTPAVADPGADLAKACADAGCAVVPIPGPCAPAAAVAAAGALTPDEPGFAFVGFLPPKTVARRKRWRKFANAPGSVVAFVPPHKLVATLTDAAAELGEGRACVVCREMTKVRFFFSAFFFEVSFPTRTARGSGSGSARGCDYTPHETIASERFIPIVAFRGDTRSGDDTHHHQSMSLRVRSTRGRFSFFSCAFFFFSVYPR